MVSMLTVAYACVVLVLHVSVAWLLRPHVGRSLQLLFLRPAGVCLPRRSLAPRYCAVTEDNTKYTYLEDGVEYDVPFIKDPMW